MSRRVLNVSIVEDYDRLRQTLENLIDRLDGFTLCASRDNAEAALAGLQELQPDVMLIDIAMPGMNGIELLAEVRKRYPHIVCIIISGHRSARYVAQARAAGAAAFIVKTELHRLEEILPKILEANAPFYAYGIGRRESEAELSFAASQENRSDADKTIGCGSISWRATIIGRGPKVL